MSQNAGIEITTQPTGPVAPEAKQPEGEQLIGGKFKTQEDLLAAYQALEQKLGSIGTGEDKSDASKPDAKNGNPGASPGEKSPENGGESKMPDFSEFEKEFAETGGLSNESYSKLEQMGYPRGLVDSYIQAQKLAAKGLEAETHALLNEFGGAEQYGQMVEWARTNLSPSEIAAYNKAVSSGDRDQIKLAISGLQQQFNARHGKAPNILGGGRGISGAAPFQSMAQLKEAMKDPRYKTDPAYRDEVAKRLKASKLF